MCKQLQRAAASSVSAAEAASLRDRVASLELEALVSDSRRRGSLRPLANVRGKFDGLRSKLKGTQRLYEATRKALAENMAAQAVLLLQRQV
eukprot:3866474-Pleurochrysis_carterae.AAC.1